jgi:CzcA family heavy metal efflux pump
MWIVRLALRKPYTFTVMALAIIILGLLSALRMPKDIFPAINVPVVSVVWTFNGLTPPEMEQRIVTLSERSITTAVNDVEHLESQSLLGYGIVKVYFQPGASIDAAVAQVTAINEAVLSRMPPGVNPPVVIRFNATNVPVIQLGVSSSTVAEQTLFDLALNSIRIQLATVQGASIPLPIGGKARQINIDLIPELLQAKGITPAQVSAAINAQNLTLPSGTVKIGDREYGVLLNSSANYVSDLAKIPISIVNGATITIGDVAQVRDGFQPQTNIVRQNGHRGILIAIYKNGEASTLDVIDRVRKTLPRILTTVPQNVNIVPQFDQSLFVRSALNGVVREAILAALLTATMILLFLGSWRNTLVVALSIPLSIFCSLICLGALGQTINAMTLGGLALAVGILVDDATVTIENIERNLGQDKTLIKAILDGAEQIATPAFVSTLCICIVFIPIFFLTGVAKFLFSPLAIAVIFAMLASYFLSRTVVPTFVHFLLKGHAGKGHSETPSGVIWEIHTRFNTKYEQLRTRYLKVLEWCLNHTKQVIIIMISLMLISGVLLSFVGRDFFPKVDAGTFKLHVRVPPGTRIEETERIFSKIEAVIKSNIPTEQLTAIVDNIGLPNSGINIANSDLATVGTADGDILVSLNAEKHDSTFKYLSDIRMRLINEFPDCQFFAQSSDIVSQILNFGLPAPIDLQIAGKDIVNNYAIAQELTRRIAKIPGAIDVHIHQVVNDPTLHIEVDRMKAVSLGLGLNTIASNLLISLSGSGATAPNFWVSPENGIQYSVVTQTPQYKINSLDNLLNIPVSGSPLMQIPQTLRNVAKVTRTQSPAVVSHYNIQPVFDVYANVEGKDLGSVASKVRDLLPEFSAKLKRGSFITLRGQVQSMDDAFFGLGIGIIFAIILVYLLMVVNFQSWVDPLIIIMALPGALCGIVWVLLLTHTTLNVPSLMGAIMSIGVATANSILIVTFANDLRKEGKDAKAAALEAGSTRLRPVLMTALAMLIGMLPMALGLGEGGEQNAPLGRAVIGGLTLATLATLLFVPVVYAHLRKHNAHRPEEEIQEELNETS